MYRFLLCFLFMISSASAVYAHAHVASSQPADGALLAASPDEVKITFSEPLRSSESLVRLYDASQKEIKGTIVTRKANDSTLELTLPKLAAGSYIVQWKAVCLCTDHHATQGKFQFTVK